MPHNPERFHASLQAHDDQIVNPSTSAEQLASPLRRDLMKGSLLLAAFGFIGGGLTACSRGPGSPDISFNPVPLQLDPDFDVVRVADGYTARPFFSWGDPVEAGAPEWQADASDDWQAQLKQAGDNHDGMNFFAFPDQADRGLLVMNHEYINPFLHPHSRIDISQPRLEAEVLKEQAAHGVSIIEVKKVDGQWQRVMDSAYNRRISAMTSMRLSGPLAGHPLVKTAADTHGIEVFGTLNNCATGVTPWGTYLTCEENWPNYFVNRDSADYNQRVAHKRYGIANAETSKYYRWESVDPRFDATPQSIRPHGGFVNEPNRFGWVVEIDPFDPHSQPIKRTAFGRFSRECAALAQDETGRMAFYSGDDARGEYIYKFVPSGKFDPANPNANRDLLDSGTLYVARLHDSGRGEWLPLVHGHQGLTEANGFADQATVLVNARAAADLLGATPMDRPEWATVHPVTREVYVSLTNNTDRGSKFSVDKANPRANNVHGQILRLNEIDADPAATEFQWDLFLLAGEAAGSVDSAGKPVPENQIGNIKGDIFSSPDGLAFDSAGRLWIQTDYDDFTPTTAAMGCNQLLCADPVTRQVRRFLVGPRGCEITGLAWSPDGKAMWVNIQHPTLSFPASDGSTRPRSTTMLITKNDGGLIGTGAVVPA